MWKRWCTEEVIILQLLMKSWFQQASSVDAKTIRWKVDGELDVHVEPQPYPIDHLSHKEKNMVL